MTHPYSDLGGTAFWRSGVAEADPAAPVDLYRPKFALGRDAAIATAGSCFAQHVGRALRGAGLRVRDAEPAPSGCPQEVARAYGYGIYSARYGNIYTVRQLVQLIGDAVTGHTAPADIWAHEGRFYDAMSRRSSRAALPRPKRRWLCGARICGRCRGFSPGPRA